TSSTRRHACVARSKRSTRSLPTAATIATRSRSGSNVVDPMYPKSRSDAGRASPRAREPNRMSRLRPEAVSAAVVAAAIASTESTRHRSSVAKGGHHASLKSEVSSLRLQTSDFRLQTSDFRLQTLNVPSQSVLPLRHLDADRSQPLVRQRAVPG